ncbi:MAG: tyrosine-type recombinase/integrase [Campylobacterales bacterium]|nr:tyrosine-type recombinase/integrase [Campylobacterales bacterium]
MNYINDYITSFLGYLKDNRGYSETTITTYKIALKQMVEISEIYEENGLLIIDIKKYRMAIFKQNKKTISKKLSAIRSLSQYLFQIDIKNRVIGDDSIKTSKTLPKPIQKNHIDEAIKQANLIEKTILYMLFGLGLRISELSNVKLSDIGSSWINIVGKGDKTRELPLVQNVKDVIENYILVYKPKYYLLEVENKKFGVYHIRTTLKELFKKIGIKATPHQLRHSFASEMLNNGARITDVKELLGHSSLETTQIYTKLTDQTKLKNYLSSHPLCKVSHEHN